MPKRRIPLVTGSYRDSNRHWSRQECIGWMPVRAEQPGTLTEWRLRQLPGCKPFVYVGTSVAGESGPEFTPAGVNRGLRNVEGKLFVVSGNQLYQISNSGVAIPRGTIPGVGRVSMAHNANGLGNELLVVNGFAGYVWNTQTQAFGKVTDTGYPGAFIADFVDQYLAQVEPGGRYWFHSDLADAHSYNTLDQYVAEGDPDRIVSLIVSHREVLVLGKKTIEPYVNTGGATGTFERASNTVIEVGCSARYSVKRMDGSPFWLDDQRLVRRLDGYTPVILSTDPVAQAFAECTEAEIAQAYAFTWEPAGHKVYYITVPGRFTFGYDAKTGQWHRRKTYGLNHWAVVDVVSWNGKWIAADSRSSKLYELSDAYPLDECDPLERELTAPTVWADQNPLTLDSVELMLDAAGQSVECVEFPEQPLGPSISGSAPNGVEGDSYTFSYTVTPGDSPIARTILISGALPEGLAWNELTATISGTPVETGVFSFRLRTIDANGLTDDLDDTISVSWVMAALGTTGGTNYRVLRVVNDEVWNGALSDPGATYHYILGGDAGRIILWSTTDLAFSDNDGGSWTTSVSSMGGAGGPRAGARKEGTGTILIGGGINGLYRSTNNATTVANIADPEVQYVGYLGPLLISASIYSNNFWFSADDGVTFTEGEAHGVTLGSGGGMACGSRVAILAAAQSAATNVYCAITDDGVAVQNVLIAAGSDYAKAATVGEIDGTEVFLVGTDDGKVYLSEDDGQTWELVFTADGTITAMAFTGSKFVVASKGLDVHLYLSPDGRDWDETPTSLTGHIHGIARV